MHDTLPARNDAVEQATAEDAVDRCIATLWPKPANGLAYVHQTLSGGEYVSTGLFPRSVLGPRGTGRTVANCTRVTTLMWDADLATLYTALLLSRGRPVPPRRAQLKEQLYRLPAEHLRILRRVLFDQLAPVWADVMGFQPTAVIDSGWGLHIHLAVDPLLGLRIDDLSKLHGDLTRRMNEAASSVASALRPALQIGELFDRLSVGAQLARMPGTVNQKCAWQRRNVTLVEFSPASELDAEAWDRLRLDVGQQDDLFSGFGGEGAAVQVASADAPAPAAEASELDFSLQMCGGRSWEDIAYSLPPGERLKVVCPFGGPSPGSGFFHREQDGRARYYSNILHRTFWDTIVRKRAVGGHRPRLRMRTVKKKQVPVNQVSNLLTLLRGDPTFDLWWCDWSHKLMDGAHQVDDEWALGVRRLMEDTYEWYWAGASNLMVSAATTVAKERRRNPVVEYLEGLSWDGTVRLPRWPERVLAQGKDDELASEYGLRWAIGLVARALEPGCKNDVMMLLLGKQGIGKSRMWAAWMDGIVPEQSSIELFSDTPVDLGRDAKDAYIVYRTCWVHEDAELMAHHSAGPAARKAFLSSRQDTFREPYQRYAITTKRHTVSVGTSNNPTPLTDPSGSRRYYVLDCKSVRLHWLRTHRDQLLAEAVYRYKLGERWWLDDDQTALQIERNRQYVRTSAWQAVLSEAHAFCLEKHPNAALSLPAIMQSLRAHPQRDFSAVSAALMSAGWLRVRQRSVSRYRVTSEAPDPRHIGPDTRAVFDEVDRLYGLWIAQ